MNINTHVANFNIYFPASVKLRQHQPKRFTKNSLLFRHWVSHPCQAVYEWTDVDKWTADQQTGAVPAALLSSWQADSHPKTELHWPDDGYFIDASLRADISAVLWMRPNFSLSIQLAPIWLLMLGLIVFSMLIVFLHFLCL